jgi:hypothetical protein
VRALRGVFITFGGPQAHDHSTIRSAVTSTQRDDAIAAGPTTAHLCGTIDVRPSRGVWNRGIDHSILAAIPWEGVRGALSQFHCSAEPHRPASGRENLFLDFWHANGRDQVTVLEKEGRLRIETTRNSLPLYLFTLHETTAAFHSGDWRMQLWADYNEFALWCLLGMIASGFAMFLAARWRSRLALISLVAGCCLFGALYFFTK